MNRYALRSHFEGDRRGEAAAELVAKEDDVARRDLMEVSAAAAR